MSARRWAAWARFAVIAAAACAKNAAPAEPAPQRVVVSPPTPAADPEPAAEAPPPDRAEPEAVVGIPQCDRYLASYRDCAAKLAPEVAAGQRRAYPSERAWLLHLKSSGEAPSLPAACDDMLRELERACR